MKNYFSIIKNLIAKKLTISRGSSKISQTRELIPSPIRELRPAADSFHCPYCLSTNYKKRGFRQKKLEKVQLYLCLTCRKTFTLHLTKGKHYPLNIMLDAIGIYNLGYSLEKTCRIVNKRQQKIRLSNADFSTNKQVDTYSPDLSRTNLSQNSSLVIEPPLPDSTDQEQLRPTPNSVYIMDLQPSTLSNWLSETAELCRFSRLRPYALKKYSPRDMVIHATLAHRQLYRYRYHRAKCALIINDDFKHRRFGPLQEFLQMVPAECPHQYFSQGLRASETPLSFSKTQMIVRAKQNYANKLCAFVLQSVKDRKQRHEALQKFMLANDSVTVATEVPVYLTRDDLEHMQTQLGFEIYSSVIASKTKQSHEITTSPSAPRNDKVELPKLITGHIDIVQIRNGQIHILDYKPNAEKERPIEQLTLYAMALSRLTGLRLFEFKCAWFDEKNYFEFYPLHVLHKSPKTNRRRKVYTMEGTYAVNQDVDRIKSLQPITQKTKNYVIH